MTEVGDYLPPRMFTSAAQDLEECRFVCMTTDGKVDYVGADCANQHRIWGVTLERASSGDAVKVATYPGDQVWIATKYDTVLGVGDIVVSDADGKAKKAAVEDDANIIHGIVLGPEKSVAREGVHTKILMK